MVLCRITFPPIALPLQILSYFLIDCTVNNNLIKYTITLIILFLYRITINETYNNNNSNNNNWNSYIFRHRNNNIILYRKCGQILCGNRISYIIFRLNAHSI